MKKTYRGKNSPARRPDSKNARPAEKQQQKPAEKKPVQAVKTAPKAPKEQPKKSASVAAVKNAAKLPKRTPKPVQSAEKPAKEKKNYLSYLTNGIIKENPTLRLVLGTCPTLAVTTMATNGLGMGLAATLVLIGSNVVISLLRKVIPDKVRIPAFITVIAGFVSVIQLLVKAYAPELDESLGIYLPLIVVNCIILARAEMFASKNAVLASFLDGLGMGIGFTAALVLMGSIRELLGAGTLFGLTITAGAIEPMLIFILPPGGFFVFGVLIALANKLTKSNDAPTGCAVCGAREFCSAAQKAQCEQSKEEANAQ